MGVTGSGIHIFGDCAPVDCGFSFRSFCCNWQTCVDDFSEKMPDYPYKVARFLSKCTDAPVLYFEVYDSEMISFAFLRQGKIASRYSDDEGVANKKLFDIPSMIGYEDGQKKRLSTILSCADVECKMAMLEEYFGLCLLYLPELSDEELCRNRDDSLYHHYQAEQKLLTGKAAPVHLNQIAEYPGKLFWDFFGRNHLERIKPHCFLHGYTSDHSGGLLSVRFTGTGLEPMNLSAFEQDRIRRPDTDPRFRIDYGTPCKVTFSEDCPPEYRDRTMTLPGGFFPEGFTKHNELLLQGNHRIYVADSSLKIIAKLSIKGEIADILEDYILTTTGDSFCGYCFEPKAKIRIYELVR